MATIQSAIKRNRQAEKRRQRNVPRRSALRSQLKKTLRSLQGEANPARAEYIRLSSMLDRLAGKHLIHKNKAARHKRQLAARLRDAATQG